MLSFINKNGGAKVPEPGVFTPDDEALLRAARFEATLGFELDPQTAEPIARLRELLGGVPPARLFDETLKQIAQNDSSRSVRRAAAAALASQRAAS